MNPRQRFRASRCLARTSLSWCAVLLFAASAEGQIPTTPVGTASAPQTATVTITTAGTLSTIYVLTQGATGLDFNPVSPSGGTCTAATAYNVGDTCTVQYTFSPTHPWVRYGSVSLNDSSGILLGNVFLAGLGTGPQVSYPLSAATVPGPLGSGFSSPMGVAVDARGNVYIADTGNNAIKELVAVGGVVPANPTITTLASGFNAPSSVAVDGAGNVYFADTGNNAVKQIVAVGGVLPASPTILTLSNTFAGPKGVAVDGSGNVFVADTLNDGIKEILAVNGVIPATNPTINSLGSGFMAPTGVFVDGSGNVFVADTGHALIKEILAVGGAIPATNPTINTLGSGFTAPRGVSVDGGGNVYVADASSSAIKEITGAGILSLGTGYTSPNAVALDSNGNVFVTDNGTNLASGMNVQNPPTLSFTAATALGATSTDSPRSFSLLNNGNMPLIFSIPTTGNNPVISPGFAFDATTTCPQLTPGSTATGSLGAGSSCIDAVNFTPRVAGAVTGSVTSTDNNLNVAGSTQSTSLSGTGTPGTPSVTVTSPSVPVNTSSVNLAASISFTGIAPTGSVTFTVNSGTAIAGTCTGTSTPLSCTAPYNPSSLTAGTYPIQVSIASDSNYNSASASGTLTIAQGTPTLVVSSSGASTVNGAVTFTVAVTPNSGIVPTGSVSLATMLNNTPSAIASCTSLALTSGAGPTLTATCQTSALSAGSNSITATIASDTNFVTNTSAPLIQTVNQGTPALTLSASGASTVNDSVTFTVTVTPNTGIVPNGAVTFNTALGAGAPAPIGGCTSLTLGANGAPPLTATCTTTALMAGSNAITATIAASSNFVTATSNTVTQTVAKATPTLTLSQSPTSSMVNDAVTFTVAVSPNSGILPGAGITFSTTVAAGTANAIAGCTNVALVSGPGPTLTASCPTRTLLAGSNVVTAVIVSDANFNAATSNPVTQPVSKATTSLSLTSSQPTSSTVDQSVTFTASISQPGGNPFTTSPAGTVSFTANSSAITGCSAVTVDSSTHAAVCATSALVAPSDVIVATYSSDPNFLGSTSPQLTQIVNKNTPAISVSSTLPTSATVNQTVTFTATITPNGASSAGVVPMGNVTFTRNGANICAPVVVSASNGVATASCPATFSTVFSGASIVATYSGDSNINAVTATVSQTVLPGSTTTSVTSATNPSSVNQSVNLTATVTAATPGTATPMSGSVTFTDSADAANPFCTTTLTFSGGTLQPAVCPHVFTSSGNHIVTAAFTSTDANFNNSATANGVIQVVNAASTALTVANTSSSTPTVNQTATFQATFSSPGQALPQGTVTYSDGATPICQNLPITSGAVPSCMITFLTAGDHFITAAFTSSDANFANVTSAQFRQPVNKNTPSVAVASSQPASAVVNQTVAFSATVTPSQVLSSSLAPTGSVTFTRGQGGPVLCSSASVTTGPGSTALASCSVAFNSVYAAGTTIVATYSGDTNFLSNGGTVSQTVLKGATTTTVTSATNPSAVNQSVTLTAAVTPTIASGPAFPQSGSLTFSDSTDPTNTFCPTTLTVSAGVLQPATCQHIFASSGPHTVTAAFTSTDPNFSNSTTANGLAQMVNPAVVALNVTSSSAPMVNQQATFQATFSPVGQAIPQGTVSYSDGSTIICPAMAVSAGAAPACTATFLTAGSHSITATFMPSDGNFQQTTSAPFLLTVSQSTPTVAITSPVSTSNPTVGQGQTFTASVTPAAGSGNTAPTGNVTFVYSVVTPTATRTGTICSTNALVASGSVASASCPSLTPLILQGTYTITAQYSGDWNFTAAPSATLREAVGRATTGLAVGAPPTPQINVPTLFTPSLSITSMLAPSGTQTTQPTGLFTLTDGSAANAPVICNVQIAATGTITCPTYTFSSAGAHTIYATYAGDDNFSASTATPTTITVATATPTITVTSSSPSNTSVATQTVVFTATVRAAPAGSIAPTNPNGNINFSIAQSGSATSFACSPTPPPTTGTTTSTVTASCTVTGFGSRVAGTIAVVATYSGDANYSAVTSAPLNQTVQNFSPAISPARLSLAQGTATTPNTNAIDPFQKIPVQFSVNPASGFADATTTACSIVDASNAPVTGVSCATSVTSATAASVTVTATSAAPVGDYTIRLTTTDTATPSLSQTSTATVTILNQPATILNVGVGTSAATFTLPSSLASTSPFSCNNANLAVYNSSTKTYASSTTFAQVGITCSSIIAGATAGTYSFTITSAGATARLENGPGKIWVALFGAPFLLLIGLFPGSRKNGKPLPRLLSMIVLTALSLSVTGCGGGFTRTALATTAVNGSYLIQIVNAQGVTVAEVPLTIGSGS